MVTMTKQVRSVLSHRSVKDKIGVAADCELCPVGDLDVVSMLVREGYLVWIDRAAIPRLIAFLVDNSKSWRMMPVISDVYQLTPKGVALCEQHGIKRR